MGHLEENHTSIDLRESHHLSQVENGSILHKKNHLEDETRHLKDGTHRLDDGFHLLSGGIGKIHQWSVHHLDGHLGQLKVVCHPNDQIELLIELKQLGVDHQIVKEVDLMNEVDEVDHVTVLGVAGHVIETGSTGYKIQSDGADPVTGSGAVDPVTEADLVIVTAAAGLESTTEETGLEIVTEGTHADAEITQETIVPTRKTAVTLKSKIK